MAGMLLEAGKTQLRVDRANDEGLEMQRKENDFIEPKMKAFFKKKKENQFFIFIYSMWKNQMKTANKLNLKGKNKQEINSKFF